MSIDAIKNQPTPYSAVKKCSACGLGMLDPLPPADAIPSFYVLDSYYTHGDGHVVKRPPTIADKILTKLAWLMDRRRPFEPAQIAERLPKGGKVCDLGCGHAHHLKRFLDLGFEVTGVDPDAAAREFAALAGITVEAGTGEDVPDTLSEGSFDLVLMTHSLEHCRNPRKALENVFRLTKPGGLCYIEVPNCTAEHFKTFTVCSTMFDAPRHMYFFSPTNLKQLMRNIGFVPIDMLYDGYVRQFDQSWRGWETTIADRLASHDPSQKPRRHSFFSSVLLLLRSFWRSPDEKYDSFGLLMQRPQV
ncbi:SAM-dependent methyltransferase [Sphingobium subterraneum]|uniref:SAM-dependent methyltransferase n=2 Tax=Sphingobium subterraneum TaxID=627688 RepID=A0A841J0V3_9SPHN|nr:SAM-dependent methyltransferase [Sphingobium subterraneum]